MEIRDRILHKAHDLFNRHGIRRVTMDEIASQLGMSKKTIYQFFADKDELVKAITEEHLQKNRESCSLEKTKATDAIHEIFLTLDMMQEMLGYINPTMIHDLEKFHPDSFEKFNQFKEQYLYNVVKDNLTWGIAEGLYREELNKEVITKLRLNLIFLPFNQDIFPQNKYNLAEVAKEIIEHYLYGLATAKGYKLIIKYKQERIKTTKYE